VSLKHKHFTVSHHNYSTLPLYNLQLHVKFYLHWKLQRFLNYRYIIEKKKQFTAAFRYNCPWNHCSKKLSFENFTAWNKRETWSFTISTDIIYSCTGVFRKVAKSLVRSCAHIWSGRLYGANISVEYYRTGICTCHLTRYVQRNTVLSLNTICSCHLTTVIGKLFYHGLDHLFNSYWRPTTF